jgi:outer membrane protein insertion porin family
VNEDRIPQPRWWRLSSVLLAVLAQVASPVLAQNQVPARPLQQPQQQPPPRAPAPVPTRLPGPRQELRGQAVEEVRVLGNKQVPTASILNVVRTRAGDPFDPETVREDYQRIYGLRKFSNVEAKVEPTDTGVVVVFIVTEQRQISTITFRGNTAIDNDRLRAIINVSEGEAIDRFRLALARQGIENVYRDKNYPFAHVEVLPEPLAERGEVVFQVVEGPNVRVRNIDFVGAKSFGEDRLKRQIQTKTWVFVIRPGTFSPEVVEDDVAAIQRYYQNKGFADVRVGRKLIWSPDMSELQINFVVEEGPRYIVDRVSFRGISGVSEAQLRQNLRLREGMPYDADVVQRDVRSIVRAYSPLGYIYQPQLTNPDPDYLQVEPRQVFGREPGRVELVYDISEGKSFRVGRVIVKGNSRTQDKVVLREMRVVPGQLYNSAELQDAVERLRATPYFGGAQVTPIGNDPEYRDVLVEVQEERTARFLVGAGINSNGGVGGNITYEQQNFDIMNWPRGWDELFSDRAFIGAGQTFRASVEPGTEATNISLFFSEPYIFDQNYGFSAEAYLRNRVREDYNDDRLGGRVSLTKRFNYVWSARLSLRGESVNITDIDDPEIRADEILEEEGYSTLTSVGLQIRRDTTNRGLLPSEGTTTTLGWESFGAIGGDFTFQRFTLGWDGYKTLYEDLLDRKTILALHGDAGYITGDAPFFERFYGGGIGSVRGFQFRGISPRSGPDDDRVGGDFSLFGSAEVSFPLTGDNLRGVVFVDAGTVEEHFEFGTIRTSVGAGIRLVLPFLGQTPIAVDLAYPITKDDDDDTQIISFSFGISR